MKALGLGVVALAIIVAVLPFFNNCLYEGKSLTLANGNMVPMKCYWTARAEIALGIPLIGLGGMLAFSKRRETRRSIGLLGALLGVFVVLLPTELIGVCTSMSSACNLIMKPAMTGVGALLVATNLAVLVISQKQVEESYEPSRIGLQEY